MRVGIDSCRRRLAALWLLLSGGAFLFVLALSLTGFYGEDFGWVWGWFLPTILPTLSLIIGVLVAEALRTERSTHTVDQFLYRMSWWLSAGYLILVLLTLAAQPFSPIPPADLLPKSQYWLAPIQGLVSASLGAFFVRSEQAKASDSPEGSAGGSA